MTRASPLHLHPVLSLSSSLLQSYSLERLARLL